MEISPKQAAEVSARDVPYVLDAGVIVMHEAPDLRLIGVVLHVKHPETGAIFDLMVRATIPNAVQLANELGSVLRSQNRPGPSPI